MSAKPIMARSGAVLLLVVALAAVGLRIAAARGELWVDEIWSVEIARQVSSPLALLSEARHDNNHLLNTAYLQLLGDTRSSLAIRAPSVLAGVASLLVVVWIALARGRAEAMIGLLLFGVSYPFVLYGSEARGYSQAVFFALLAYGALVRHLETPRAWSAAVFSLCGVLGPLAHLTYVHFTLGALLWSGLVWLRGWLQDGLPAARVANELARCHAAPVVSVLLLYVFFVRGMTIAGGPDYSFAYALARASALMLGLPAGPDWLIPALGIAAVATLGGLAWLARRQPVEALGLALIGLVSPALVIAASQPELIYPRYFLVSLCFVLLVWVRTLSGLLAQGAAAGWLARALLASLLLGHLFHDLGLARNGRSQFAAALETARTRESTPVERIAVGSDAISQAMLRFYAPSPGPDGPRHPGWSSLPSQGAEWLILPALEDPANAPELRRDRHGNRYRLVGVRPVARESGFATLVYQADSSVR